jgi:hypothetical protein
VTLTVRSATVSGATTKGSALTHAELDENFNHLSQSSNHTFTQSGSGASSRTVQAKLRDIVAVKDFGAVLDGSTDDSTALSNAYTACDTAGADLFINPGTLKTTSAQTWDQQVSVYGVPGRSYIKPSSAVTTIALTINNTAESGAGTSAQTRIHGIALNGSDTSGATGVKVGTTGTTSFVALEWCDIKGFTGASAKGLYVADAVLTNFTNCDISRNSRNVHIAGSTSAFPTTINFHNCRFYLASVDNGVHIVNGDAISFTGKCVFESNKNYGLHIAPTANLYATKVVVDGGWFEDNWTGDASQNTRHSIFVDGTAAGTTTELALRNVRFNNGASTEKAFNFDKITLGIVDNCRAYDSATQFIIANSASVVSFDNMIAGVLDTQISNPDSATIIGSYKVKKDIEAAWSTWVPSFTGGGSMTFTTTTAHVAKYKKNGKTVHIELWVTGTVGGTPSALIVSTLPSGVVPQNTGNYTPCAIKNNGTWESGLLEFGASDGVYFRRTAGNWTAAADCGFAIAVSFESE